MIDYDNPKHEIQEWLLAYKTYKDMGRGVWVSINFPKEVTKSTVEKILIDLNKEYEIIYARRIMGVFEDGKKNHYKKGEFLGL